MMDNIPSGALFLIFIIFSYTILSLRIIRHFRRKTEISRRYEEIVETGYLHEDLIECMNAKEYPTIYYSRNHDLGREFQVLCSIITSDPKMLPYSSVFVSTYDPSENITTIHAVNTGYTRQSKMSEIQRRKLQYVFRRMIRSLRSYLRERNSSRSHIDPRTLFRMEYLDYKRSIDLSGNALSRVDRTITSMGCDKYYSLTFHSEQGRSIQNIHCLKVRKVKKREENIRVFILNVIYHRQRRMTEVEIVFIQPLVSPRVDLSLRAGDFDAIEIFTKDLIEVIG